MTYFPSLASKSLSLELYTLCPTWDDTSHFRINGQKSGIVNTEIIQRKFIHQDRLTPAYDMSYLFNKLLELEHPGMAFNKWFQNYFSDVSLEDALAMTLIKLIRKEEL